MERIQRETQPEQAEQAKVQKQALKVGSGPTSRDLEPVQAKEASGGFAGGGSPPTSGGDRGGGASSTGEGSGRLPSIQLRRADTPAAAPPDADTLHQTAAEGVAGSGGQLPFLDRIQASFGRHGVSDIRAHTGAAASKAATAMGAEAYATGGDVAFGGTPSLHTAAHEAAHVVQQRAGVSLQGGVGQPGDAYEQHADAVADRVVQGESAEDLLSQMGPAAGGDAGGVQAKALQFDIKADLRKAMEGWGTDEAAIFARLQRASVPELQAVVADQALLNELKDELSVSDMERVLDLVNAPLAQKLRLAMSGWLNDNAYIRRSLDRASPAELAAAGQDAQLVNELVDNLGSAFLKTVLDRMSVPLARKIEYALSGWGADQEYVNQSIATAPPPQVVALASNATLMSRLDAENWDGLRASIARRIMQGGGSADDAFKVLVTDDDALLDRRLEEYGSIEQQRLLLDGVITAGVDAKRVQRAFHAYWHVQVNSAAAVAATTNGGDNGAPTPAVAARDWPIATLQAIHRQMKLLPDQDARSGIWNTLSLTNEPSLINRAAYGGGNFLVGSNASTTSTVGAGYGVTLTAAAAKSQRTLEVSEGTRFQVGDSLALDRSGPNKETHKVATIAGNTYTMDADLANDHPRGTILDPDDGSGLRDVNWLDATVRHEIAHSLDGGGCDTSGFYAKGEWVLGQGDAGFDAWVTAMGGDSAWTTNDGSTISDADKATIKATIVDHVANRKGSMFTALAGNATHPVMVNQNKAVPVIVAAEQCFRLGDFFYTQPTALYAANGKRFAISWWYRRFQHHNELVVTDRVADYGLYAPTEFFAEAYTVFYEEAGRPGVKDEDYGRLIRNSDWRGWIRDRVHNRGLAPAGTGAAPAAPGSSIPAQESGARPGGASRGRASGNPGM